MPENACTHFFSTRSAIAYGRYFSNSSGVFSSRSIWSFSTRPRNSSKPSTFSRARAPVIVRADMNHPKIAITAPVATPATIQVPEAIPVVCDKYPVPATIRKPITRPAPT